MHRQQRQQAHELLRSRGVTRALFANTHTLTWLTGYAPPIQLGNNLFAGGPPRLWYDDGHWTLLVLDALASAAGDLAADADCDVATYPGYTIEQPIESAKLLAEALGRDGNRFQIETEGLLARAIQHEIDHLNGLLIIDRISNIKRKLLRSNLEKLKQEAP